MARRKAAPNIGGHGGKAKGLKKRRKVSSYWMPILIVSDANSD
jgi:hypothetical protein